MKITCESCGAKYTIADDKVIGRKVKIRCKGCSTPIVVDGQKLGPSAAPPGSPDAKAETLLPQPSPDWSVNLSETDQRSMTTQQLVEAFQSGQVTPEAYVWREGMADWVPLLDCAELAPLLTPAAGAMPTPPFPEQQPAYTSPQAVFPEPGFPQAGHSAPAAAEPQPPPAEPSPEQAASVAPSTETPAPAPSTETAAPTPTPAAAAAKPATEKARAIRAQSGAQAKASADPAAVPRSTVSARITGGRSQGAHDLFAGVESAGSEALDVPITGPSLPQAGSTAYADDRPTGARNENSVLFSLDSMKAANLSASPSTQQRPDDPFGMGGSTGIAGLGGGNPLFTLADNQRLLSAPPPPPEPPPRPVAIAVPSVAPGGGVTLTRQMLGIIAGGVLLILLLGVGIGAMLSGDEESTEAASASAATSAAPVAASDEKTEKAEKEPEPAASPPSDAPAPPPSAEAKADDKDGKSPSGATGKQPSGGSARKDAKKDDAPAPVTADQPFNRGAAVAAMSAAASQASGCKKPGGPTGSGKATLTFAPTGRVTSATVDSPPFAGTAVGGCVASIFRRAKVPPFTGNPIRVSKSFSIN
jgi:predicted Zn finger-like uncharacterized protein